MKPSYRTYLRQDVLAMRRHAAGRQRRRALADLVARLPLPRIDARPYSVRRP